MAKKQKVKPHVIVILYAVQEQTFNNADTEYWHAEVTHEGLQFNEPELLQTTKKGKEIWSEGQSDPWGWSECGYNEIAVKEKMREYLKECGFSKKQIEFRRV